MCCFMLNLHTAGVKLQTQLDFRSVFNFGHQQRDEFALPFNSLKLEKATATGAELSLLMSFVTQRVTYKC